MDGDPTKNLDAFEAVVRAMHDAGIGYGSINHPVDRGEPESAATTALSGIAAQC